MLNSIITTRSYFVIVKMVIQASHYYSLREIISWYTKRKPGRKLK